MSQQYKYYYLQHMGIEPWTMREQKSSCSNILPLNQPEEALNRLAMQVTACERCPLHQTRTQTVFSRGHPQAKLMIVGEAPGYYEDQQGQPFVGKAGSLLNRMLQSIGYREEDVYIANVLKCRPPNNRDPRPEEIAACSDYLHQQITYVAPRLILALGRFAGQFLLKQPLSLAEMRRQMHTYASDIPVIVSYHPAYLLRRPEDKKKAFEDLYKIYSMSLICSAKP